MAKSRRAIKEALQVYSKRINKYFPYAEMEAIYQPGDGHDAWVNIEMPVADSGDREVKLRQIIDLDEELWDETGVSVVGILVQKRLEGAHHG